MNLEGVASLSALMRAAASPEPALQPAVAPKETIVQKTPPAVPLDGEPTDPDLTGPERPRLDVYA